MSVSTLETFNQAKLQCATLNLIGDLANPANDGFTCNDVIKIQTISMPQLKMYYDDTNFTYLQTTSGGDLIVGTSGQDVNVTSSTKLHVLNVTDTTKIDEGALQVIGGVGIAKNLHVGGVVNTKLASAPLSPVEGDMFYNSATKKLEYYNGTIWVSL